MLQVNSCGLRQCCEDHPDLDDLDAGPEEILIRKEQEEEFMKLLGELTPPHRAVVILHFVEDFSLEEIAGITGVQIGTVKSRLHYAKKMLKKLLSRHEP